MRYTTQVNFMAYKWKISTTNVTVIEYKWRH